ncbi:uncharacterized protein LOC125265310 isoform X2 [Megalobrama amblycephala]|uniref:uncharacterized protein LOC125265310 isoform X2 n=1 Tax=Megalobrama amblycephala TaxID=75352 RepID=UPI0020144480|nr:uncharacterized protein LOC125265310 isoform X2 [Megalobrama amblycephala]
MSQCRENMHAVSVIILAFCGCFTAHVINQPKLVQQAQIGDSVTMECYFLKKDFNLIVWYKQLLGKKPQPIAKSYYMNDVHFLKGFDDGRLSVTVGNGTYHLNIFRMTHEDAATYYCGVIKFTALYFSPGTFLMITEKHSNTRRILQQPDLKPVHLGDNITLQCTVQFMEDCAQHNVYWLKQSSGESPSRIIVSHFIMADAQTCVYNFTMKIRTLSDTGIYYCAMDVDGEIITGQGTKLTITGTDQNIMNPGTFILVSSNIISAVIIVIALVKWHFIG